VPWVQEHHCRRDRILSHLRLQPPGPTSEAVRHVGCRRGDGRSPVARAGPAPPDDAAHAGDGERPAGAVTLAAWVGNGENLALPRRRAAATFGRTPGARWTSLVGCVKPVLRRSPGQPARHPLNLPRPCRIPPPARRHPPSPAPRSASSCSTPSRPGMTSDWKRCAGNTGIWFFPTGRDG